MIIRIQNKARSNTLQVRARFLLLIILVFKRSLSYLATVRYFTINGNY